MTCCGQLNDGWTSKSDNITYIHFLSKMISKETHLECQTIMCNITEKKKDREKKNMIS